MTEPTIIKDFPGKAVEKYRLTAAQAEIEQAYISLSFAGIRPNSLTEGIEALQHDIARHVQIATEQTAELERCKKDAERYRAWKKCWFGSRDLDESDRQNDLINGANTPKQMDKVMDKFAAIDAALKWKRASKRKLAEVKKEVGE